MEKSPSCYRLGGHITLYMEVEKPNKDICDTQTPVRGDEVIIYSQVVQHGDLSALVRYLVIL